MKQQVILIFFVITFGIFIGLNPVGAAEETSTDLQEMDSSLESPVQENTDLNQDDGTDAPQNSDENDTSPVQKSDYNVFKSQYLNSKGYWVWASYANTINFDSLKRQGVTDVFILTKGSTGTIYTSALKTVLYKSKGTGIRVHAWIVCFKDSSKSSSGWIDPQNVDYQNYLIKIIGDITKNYGINGIHLDYVRYSGVASKNRAAYQQTPHGAETITDFVKRVYEKVKSIKSTVAVSGVIKAETAASREWYGQDYGELAQYLDLMVPMIYKSSYGQDSAWIGKTTKYIVEKCNGTPILAGVENYLLSPEFKPLSTLTLNYDINMARINGAIGSVIFRYGIVTTGKPKNVTITKKYTKKYKKWYKSWGRWRYKWVYTKYMVKKYKTWYASYGQWKYKWTTRNYILKKYKKWYRYWGRWRYKWISKWVRIT
ncbi:MAG: putative glycoside hydrolase [Methanomicrobiales archaeon]